MSDDKEPDRLVELAKNAEVLRRQIDQGGEALRRQVEQLGQAAEQFVRDARRTALNVGPVPSFQRRVVTAADAMMRKLLPPREPVVHQVTLATTVTATADLTGVGTITATGSLALPPMRIAGQMTVEERMRGLAALSNGEIAALVLVWLYALMLPWMGSALPPELHGMLTDGYATVAIALAITWRITDKHK